MHCMPVQLTDEFVEEAMPGIGGVEGLRTQLLRTTAAQREAEQKERVHEALISAVAERVDAAIPASAIRQLAENEYQAKLHEIQLKVCCWLAHSPCLAPFYRGRKMMQSM